MADAAAMVRKAGGGDKVLRLKVHIYGSIDDGGSKNRVIDLLTTMSPLGTLYHLKTRVEHQFQPLFPTSPPLVIRAIQDKENFLLPDELVVGTILTQNDIVNCVAEGSVFQGLEPLQVASQRWDASRIVTQCMQWQSHTSAFFGANPFGSPPAVEVTVEVISLLCDMVKADPKAVAEVLDVLYATPLVTLERPSVVVSDESKKMTTVLYKYAQNLYGLDTINPSSFQEDYAHVLQQANQSIRNTQVLEAAIAKQEILLATPLEQPVVETGNDGIR